jgi:hypothetical protein
MTLRHESRGRSFNEAISREQVYDKKGLPLLTFFQETRP